MSRRIVITRTETGGGGVPVMICGIFEGGVLIEASRVPEDGQILGDIYTARVMNIAKNIDAAFVDIGAGRKCFLPLSSSAEPVYVRHCHASGLSQGDEILVQVEKEAMRGKEPRVTSALSLPGICCVATYPDRKLGVSKKIGGSLRGQLRETAQAARGGRYGIVVRTNAADHPELLADEIRLLESRLDDIVSHAAYLSGRVYAAPPEYIRILLNQPMDGIEKIVTDDADVFARLSDFALQYPSLHLDGRLDFYDDPAWSLRKVYSMETQLGRALQKKIWLASGANLVIEPTEALTVIDVNSGKNVKDRLPEEQRLQVNLEAAKEAARQLRLRNISGIIIIDFIDMASQEDEERLLAAMEGFVRDDPARTDVCGITRLGLMELTRKKVRRPLAEQIPGPGEEAD